MEASEAQEIVDRRRSQIAEKNPQVKIAGEVSQDPAPLPATQQSAETLPSQNITQPAEGMQSLEVQPSSADNLIENNQTGSTPGASQTESAA